MAGSDDINDLPEATPPEVPEEFAAAYREAYLRALQQEGLSDVDEVSPGTAPATGPEPQQAGAEGAQLDAPTAVAGRHRVTEYRSATPIERARERRWFIPVLVALLVLAVLLAGWLVARLIGGDEQPSRKDSPDTRTSTPSATRSPDEPSEPPKAPRYQGPISPAEVATVAATCTMDSGIDAAGRRVGYDAVNAVDDDPRTAWRCDGDAIGERLVLSLLGRTKVAALGLVPGYAKTDPASGEDRYAENNRIIRVRWILGPGLSFVQRLDGSAQNRELQLRRIPVTETGRVVLEILEVDEGERGATAISEITVSAPR